MALDLARDVGDRESAELHAPLRVVAIDGLDQADAADLNEVLVQLAAHAVAPGQALDQRHVLLDQALARSQVAFLPILADEALDSLPAGACRPAAGLRTLCLQANYSSPYRPFPVDPCRNRSHYARLISPVGGHIGGVELGHYSSHIFDSQILWLYIFMVRPSYAGVLTEYHC